jgi:hypothetical protein
MNSFEKEICKEPCDLTTLQSLYDLNPCTQSTLETYFSRVCCRYIYNDVNFQVAKWIYSVNPRIVTEISDETFRRICGSQHHYCKDYNGKEPNKVLELVKWIYSVQPNIPISQNSIWNICLNGRNFELIHWILTTKPECISLLTDDIFTRSVEFVKDVRIFDFYLSIKPEWSDLINDELFDITCKGYNLKVAAWIISKLPTLRDDLFEEMLDKYFSEYSEEFDREYGPYTEFYQFRFDLLELFLSYKPEFSLLQIAITILLYGPDNRMYSGKYDEEIKKYTIMCAEKNPMIYFDLRKYLLFGEEDHNDAQSSLLEWVNSIIQTYLANLEINENKHVQHIDFCSICCDQHSEVITTCNHQFCKKCIFDWFTYNNECPCCRKHMNITTLSNILS